MEALRPRQFRLGNRPPRAIGVNLSIRTRTALPSAPGLIQRVLGNPQAFSPLG